MSRQIVNTSGQGLASSEAVKFAGISLVAAVVILLLFFFLDQGTKNRPDAYQGAGTGSAMGAPNPQAS